MPIGSPKAVLKCFMESSTGEIFLSAYDPDDPLFETNHIALTELQRNGQPNKHESVLNILRNVLAQANITLEIV